MTDNPFALDYVEPEREPEECGNVSAADTGMHSASPIGITRLPSAEYHADPAPEPSLSSTLAKLIVGKSPLHAWHACRRLNPDWEPVEKKAFDIGTAVHQAVLGRGEDYVAIPDELLSADGKATTKAAKEFVAAARDAGQVPLKQCEVDQVEAMAVIARARLAERGITLDPARSELAAIAQIDGIWCRAMFDNAPADPNLPLYDFKTCTDANPETCARAVMNYGYDIQAAHYQAVWKAATGEDRPFVFIFQEKTAPFEISLIRLSGSFDDLARARAAKARRLWAECISNNNWPGYPAGLHEIDPLPWFADRAYEEAA